MEPLLRHPIKPGPDFVGDVGEGSAVESAVDLAPLSGEFRTNADVNHALGKLFCLLAQNRIPRRNAVALGYLAQLLLQTLPGVRKELTDCLGWDAWDKTLESIYGKPETEDETEEDSEAEIEVTPNLEIEAKPGVEGKDKPGAQDKTGDGRDAPASDFSQAESASERQPPIDETEAAPPPIEAYDPAPAETADELEAKLFTAPLAPGWNYWKQLEQIEHLRKMRH